MYDLVSVWSKSNVKIVQHMNLRRTQCATVPNIYTDTRYTVTAHASGCPSPISHTIFCVCARVYVSEWYSVARAFTQSPYRNQNEWMCLDFPFWWLVATSSSRRQFESKAFISSVWCLCAYLRPRVCVYVFRGRMCWCLPIVTLSQCSTHLPLCAPFVRSCVCVCMCVRVDILSVCVLATAICEYRFFRHRLPARTNSQRTFDLRYNRRRHHCVFEQYFSTLTDKTRNLILTNK